MLEEDCCRTEQSNGCLSEKDGGDTSALTTATMRSPRGWHREDGSCWHACVPTGARSLLRRCVPPERGCFRCNWIGGVDDRNGRNRGGIHDVLGFTEHVCNGNSGIGRDCVDQLGRQPGRIFQSMAGGRNSRRDAQHDAGATDAFFGLRAVGDTNDCLLPAASGTEGFYRL